MATRYPPAKVVKQWRMEGYKVRGRDIAVVKTTINPTGITASYELAHIYPDGNNIDGDIDGDKIVTKLLAKYEIKITTSGNQKQVVMTPPSSIIVIKATNTLGKEIPLERSVSEVEKDVRAVSASLDPIIKFTIKGEINVKYSDESVYANFTRMMGSYSFSNEEEAKGYDITKDHVFALKHKDKPIPVKITVYPYRDGSKVVYEFGYRYSMTVSGKTGSSISSYSQSEIDALISEISQVVND